MSAEAKIRVVAAVIEDSDGRLLLCRRPDHKRHGGLWEFPGGKVETGEDILHATRRELAEELAVRTLSVGEVLFSVDDPGSEFRIEFVPATIDGVPQCVEHSALQWVALGDLPALDLAPSDDRFVASLRSNVILR
jgi:8-oxo-dGTP diphosphatase